MNMHLRDVTSDDFPLIDQWLRVHHVRSTWGDPGANLRLLSEPRSIPGLQATADDARGVVSESSAAAPDPSC
jgi:hypothetical protein